MHILSREAGGFTKLQNVMEDLVTQKLDEVIDDLDCCKCEQCRGDIISNALNRLSPKYVNTDIGKAFVKANTLSSQFEIDILTAIYEAAAIVKARPRHAGGKSGTERKD